MPARGRSFTWLYPFLLGGVAWLILVTNLNPVKADIYFKQGQGLDQPETRDAALAAYEKALALAPNEDFYYPYAGQAYLEQAQANSAPTTRAASLEQGLQALLRARTVNPLNPGHYANLARFYRTQGQITNNPKDIAQALEYYRQANSLAPHNTQLLNEWGQTYLTIKDYEQAEAKYKQALAVEPEYEQSYLNLGELGLARKNWEQAEQAYRRLTELSPNHPQAHGSLGYIYLQQGKLAEAAREYQTVLALTPNDYTAHKNLALLYRQLERREEALKEARIAQGLAPVQERSALAAFIAELPTPSHP